jgi:hypothetical protein
MSRLPRSEGELSARLKERHADDKNVCEELPSTAQMSSLVAGRTPSQSELLDT